MTTWLRRHLPRQPTTSPAWLAVPAVVLALAGAALATAGPGLTSEPAPPPGPPDLLPAPAATPTAGPSQSPRPVADPAPPGGSLPSWLDQLATGLILALLVATAGLFVYLGVHWLLTERVAGREISDRAASQPPDESGDSEAVRDAVRAGLAELDAGQDPRRAVIACWLRLERIAATAGTPRQPADTPADLVVRLLAAHRVSDRTLWRLAEVYRLARYAPAEITGELVTTARAALGDLDAQLAPAVGLPASPQAVGGSDAT